jgi:hypothetical protein
VAFWKDELPDAALSLCFVESHLFVIPTVTASLWVMYNNMAP